MPIIRRLIEKLSTGHEHNTYQVEDNGERKIGKFKNWINPLWQNTTSESEELNLKIIDEDGLERPNEEILEGATFETQEGIRVRIGMVLLMEELKDLEKSLVGYEELMDEKKGPELIELYKNFVITCHNRFNHSENPRGHDLSGSGALRNMIDAYIQTALLKASQHLPKPMQEEVKAQCPGIYWKFYNYPVIDGKLTCLDTGLLNIENSSLTKPILSWLYHLQVAGTIELLTICAEKHNIRLKKENKPPINVNEIKTLPYDGSPFQRKTAIKIFHTMLKMMERRQVMQNQEQKSVFPKVKVPFLNTINSIRKKFEPIIDLYTAKATTKSTH